MGWADIVLTGGDSNHKITTDEMYQWLNSRPRRPGAAQQQPQQVSPQVPAAPQPTPQAPARKWSDEVLNGPATQQRPAAAAPAPKQEGWGEWAYNSIAGRQDPREAGTGTVFDQFKGELGNVTANAALGGANDAAMGDIIAKNLGDRIIRREKDANGYDVMVTRGPNGQEQRGYVNKPGLDTQDIARGVYGALPYAAAGLGIGAAAPAAGIGAQAVLQGGGSGLTSVAGDVANMAQGSNQGIDPGKAAVMTGLGAAGPVVSAAAGNLWRRFVTIPGLVDKQTGMLTPKGMEAAKRAGVDPADVTPDFAQSFAKTFAETKDPAEAAVRAGSERFGIPSTRGQVTKDPYLLTQEEGMRRRIYGEPAQDTMLGFDKRQADAVKSAALGDMSNPNARSVAGRINPDRAYGLAPMPDDIGGSIQQGVTGAREAARGAEREAWKGATGLEATDDALQSLPDTLNKSLGGLHINETVTPKAAAMAKEVDRIIAGEAPEKAAGWVANNPTRNVDQMRRTLLGYYQAAEKGSDKTAAEAIYNGFNEWIGDAAGKQLLKGDPAAALKLAEARGFTREVREIFSPRAADGTVSPAGARLAKILDPAKTDSGESVIQALFGSHGSNTPQSGAVGALRNIKLALDKFAPETGKQAWNDIRFPYWSRLVTNKGGDMLGPQAIVSNLRAAVQGKDAVIQTLYTTQEQTEIRAFLRAVQTIAYKPPNASGSGYTAASFMKDGLLKLLDSFGLGKPAMAALNYTGVGNAWNNAAARAAVSQAVKPVRPNLTPLVTGVGQSDYRR